MGNIPLVKFPRNHIRGPSDVFSISSLVSEDIDDVISRFFTVVCARSQVVYLIKRKLHGVQNNTIHTRCARS